MSKKLKIILDTNVLISFLISKELNFLDELFFSTNVKLLFSKESLHELFEVIERPKISKYFTSIKQDSLFNQLNQVSLLIDTKSKINVCRDPNDDFLLILAKDGKADYLITGDKDLLILNPFNKTKICTPTEFKENYILKLK